MKPDKIQYFVMMYDSASIAMVKDLLRKRSCKTSRMFLLCSDNIHRSLLPVPYRTLLWLMTKKAIFTPYIDIGSRPKRFTVGDFGRISLDHVFDDPHARRVLVYRAYCLAFDTHDMLADMRIDIKRAIRMLKRKVIRRPIPLKRCRH